MPLMAISLLASCGGINLNPTEDVKFSATTSVTLDETKTKADISLDWTPTDHSIECSDFTFTLTKQSSIASTIVPGELGSRPLNLIITFSSPLMFEDTGDLKFHYNDKTAKKEGEGKVTGINVKLPVDPPTPTKYALEVNCTFCTPSGNKSSYEAGANVLFTITPSKGFELSEKSGITVTGVTEYEYTTTSGVATFSCTMPAEKVTVTVTATPVTPPEPVPTFTLSATCNNGKVIGNQNRYEEGATVALTFKADPGYVLPASIDVFDKLEGVDKSMVTYNNTTGNLSFEMPAKAVTITLTATKAPEPTPDPHEVSKEEFNDACSFKNIQYVQSSSSGQTSDGTFSSQYELSPTISHMINETKVQPSFYIDQFVRNNGDGTYEKAHRTTKDESYSFSAAYITEFVTPQSENFNVSVQLTYYGLSYNSFDYNADKGVYSTTFTPTSGPQTTMTLKFQDKKLIENAAIAVDNSAKSNTTYTYATNTPKYPEVRNDLTVCIGHYDFTGDPAGTSDPSHTSILLHLNAGLSRYSPTGNKTENDLASNITKAPATVVDHVYDEDRMQWVEKQYPNGTRYTITLRDDIYWNTPTGKGDKITADDFIYSWNRASGSSLDADYSYFFEPICDAVYHQSDDTACPSIGINKVNDTTFTIDLMSDIPTFSQMFAFPISFPVNKDIIENHPLDWDSNPDVYVSSGAYRVKSWTDSELVVEKNVNYWDVENMKCDQITFALDDYSDSGFESFKNGEYDYLNYVPYEKIEEIKTDPILRDSYQTTPDLGSFFMLFNVNSSVFTDPDGQEQSEVNKAKIRKALTLLINRQSILDCYESLAIQTPANALVSTGFTDPEGGEFVDHNGPNQDGSGYFYKGVTEQEIEQNKNEAIQLLQECGYTYSNGKFIDFPSFNYLFNYGLGYKNIAESVRDTFANIGITMTLSEEYYDSFVDKRTKGDYDVVRSGCVADYNDPYDLLINFTANYSYIGSQFGKGNHASVAIYSADINRDGIIGEDERNLTWAQSYDKLFELSNQETDSKKRYKIFHEMEDLIMSTGAVCPLFFYTTAYLIKTQVKGVFITPNCLRCFHYAFYED